MSLEIGVSPLEMRRHQLVSQLFLHLQSFLQNFPNTTLRMKLPMQLTNRSLRCPIVRLLLTHSLGDHRNPSNSKISQLSNSSALQVNRLARNPKFVVEFFAVLSNQNPIPDSRSIVQGRDYRLQRDSEGLPELVYLLAYSNGYLRSDQHFYQSVW